MKKATHTQLATRHRGFTLIELMVTIAVVALLAGFVAPAMRSFVLNSRLSSTANELTRSVQSARSEAVKRQRNVVVCMSANPSAATPTCGTSGVNSWIVFEDINNNWDHESTETIIDTHTFESAKTVFSGNQSQRISFGASGFTNLTDATSALAPTTAMVMCDIRGNKGPATLSYARGIVIGQATGRPTITRVISQIRALTVTGGVDTLCPP